MIQFFFPYLSLSYGLTPIQRHQNILDIQLFYAIIYQNNHYHYRCFACCECSITLGQPFLNRFRFYHGSLYCLDDFDRLYAPRCANCHMAIRFNSIDHFERWRIESRQFNQLTQSELNSLFYKRCLKQRLFQQPQRRSTSLGRNRIK